jgi:hypothetical protein
MRRTRVVEMLAIFASLAILCGCAVLGTEPQMAVTAYVGAWETLGRIVLGVGSLCLLLALLMALVGGGSK